MWFSFPKGCAAISVEQQEFHAQYKDDNGVEYFQAPDHFAPLILGQKGFEACDRPKDAPKSLKNMEPKRDAAIKDLSQQVTALQNENTDLRTSMNSLQGEFRSTIVKLREVNDELTTRKREVEVLRERLLDHESEDEVNKAVGEAIDELQAANEEE